MSNLIELEDELSVFNLWDTNGRRSDVLNAIDIYLHILEDMQNENWGRYPDSLSQYRFYQAAIAASPEKFKKHSNYDKFIAEVDEESLLQRKVLSSSQMDNLDKNIEQRARHYTNSLKKLGFINESRSITPAGHSYLKGVVVRDDLESVLPIDDTNLILLRQLLKLRVYTLPDEDGNRIAYAPFLAALFLLMSDVRFETNEFRTIIQSLSPYSIIKPLDLLEFCRNNDFTFLDNAVVIPETFSGNNVVGQSDFEKYIKNIKSSSVEILYYEFYKRLYDYRANPSERLFDRLKATCLEDSGKLKQAFGLGKKVFDFGRLNEYDWDEFKKANKDNPLLLKGDFNSIFYTQYSLSKYYDHIKEFSDTTVRLFSATGLISFGKPLPELANADIYSSIFDLDYLQDNIFTSVSAEQFFVEEKRYHDSLSISDVLGLTHASSKRIVDNISQQLGVQSNHIRDSLRTKMSADFESFVSTHYPKERVLALLRGFSASDGGASARDQINPATGIPTAYEFIVALAWHYISDENYDLLSSMNLSMSADFEPERFAGGGDGDIVIKDTNVITMLEVTMMNSQAQKRGEWEPVLRHSVNLKASSKPKDTITFFIANELDFNTVNIWRAIAAVPLKASNCDIVVNQVEIMPLSNLELAQILESGITGTALISSVKDSYSDITQDFDHDWKAKILSAVGLN